MDELGVRELQLEMEAIREGLERYLRLGKGSRSIEDESAVQISLLAEAIRAEQQELTRFGTGGRLPEYALPLLSLKAETLAVVTLQAVFWAFGVHDPERLPELQRVARVVGRWCHLTLRASQLLRKLGPEPEFVRSDIQAELLSRNRNPNARRRVGQLLKRLQDPDSWAQRQWHLRLGAKLVELAVVHTGLVTYAKARPSLTSRHAVQFLVPTTEGERWPEAAGSTDSQMAAPLHYPMICPPLGWTSQLDDGGYLGNRETDDWPRVLDLHLVIHPHPGQDEVLRKASLLKVLHAINALQQTPWRINLAVYEFMLQAFEQKKALGNLPLKKGHPHGSRWLTTRERIQMAGQFTGLQQRLLAAKRLSGEERFYFPYRVDFRGRVYAMPQVFNPQADDVGRALLVFADGKALDAEGESWLKVHIANKFGLDKEPFDQRIAWSEDHLDDIRGFAENPLDEAHPFWQADEPWQLLAACLEWVDYERKGKRFESRLPISVDGTCNGLQHLSAMIRDRRGGEATNLLPSNRPQDIYQQVADLARQELSIRAEAGDDRARVWLPRMTRKLTKQPTMTTPYGVTRWRMANQLVDGGFVGRKADAIYVARLLEGCIGRAVQGARQVMDWLQCVTRRLAEFDRDVVWTSPAGFPVVMANRTKKARITVDNRSFTVVLRGRSIPVDAKKQARSITANFVHSFDSAHLALVVNRLQQADLRHFAVVHDSYSVHACDMTELSHALREEFVRIYRQPVLDDFVTEVRQNAAGIQGLALPNPPPPGDLDVESVLDSPYFFS